MASLLVVCTANICRSPAAAALLATSLGPGAQPVSAGVEAPADRPACATMSDWLAQRNLPTPDGHQSRRVDAALVREAALVLTLTREHRSSIVRLVPSRQVTTFTLAQAGRLARWVLAEGPAPAGEPGSTARVQWLAEELDGARAFAHQPTEPELDDLEDPHHGGEHEPVLARLHGEAAVLATLLAAT